MKKGKAENEGGRGKELYRLRDGSDSITSNFQDNAENGLVLLLPFFHNLVAELGHIGGYFLELAFVSFVKFFDGGFEAFVVDPLSDIFDSVKEIVEETHSRCELVGGG